MFSLARTAHDANAMRRCLLSQFSLETHKKFSFHFDSVLLLLLLKWIFVSLFTRDENDRRRNTEKKKENALSAVDRCMDLRCAFFRSVLVASLSTSLSLSFWNEKIERKIRCTVVAGSCTSDKDVVVCCTQTIQYECNREVISSENSPTTANDVP